MYSGHINHTLFWENLAPKKNGGGEPPSGELAAAIDQTWGSFDQFKKTFNAYLAGIQGSGWSWLVKDTETGKLQIISLPVCSLCNSRESSNTNSMNIEPGSCCRQVQAHHRRGCVGTRLLPSISEPQSRVLWRYLGCYQLEDGRKEV